MPPKIYIDDELMDKKGDENEEKQPESGNSEGIRLGNMLLSIQVESESLKLKREKEVDAMINEFLGNDSE